MEGLFWLLLPVAAYSGWYAANKQARKAHKTKPTTYTKDSSSYSEGIETFLSEQPDRAVDIVIDQVEVTPETVEVHLALGNLYRRTGQVDRAIRLHQNLTEKLSLNPLQREHVLFELGQDYLSAGLYDRAERIFKDLLKTEEYAVASSKALVEIFQQEKEWQLAIDAIVHYESISGKQKREVISQYQCEIAEEEIANQNAESAKQILLNTLKSDKNCVRANLMLAEMFYKEDDLAKALNYYFLILKQDSAFLSEIIEPMLNCLVVISKKQCLSTSIPALLDQYFDSDGNVLSGDKLIECGKAKKAFKFIEQQLEKQPSVKLLSQYLYLNIDDNQLDRQTLTRVNDVLKNISLKEAGYRCTQCGFTSHNIHWQCPGCSSWNSIKPI